MTINRNQNGFTLLGMLIGVTIAAVLVTTALPALANYKSGANAVELSAQLSTALDTARETAMRQGARVSVCALDSGTKPRCLAPGATSWNGGWAVFVDRAGKAGQIDGGDEVLEVHQPLIGDIALLGSQAAVSYAPTGTLAGAALELKLRGEECSRLQNRNIIVPVAGFHYEQTTSCGN